MIFITAPAERQLSLRASPCKIITFYWQTQVPFRQQILSKRGFILVLMRGTSVRININGENAVWENLIKIRHLLHRLVTGYGIEILATLP
jgi:hypothetical protein